jgi:hypothetical protein
MLVSISEKRTAYIFYFDNGENVLLFLLNVGNHLPHYVIS